MSVWLTGEITESNVNIPNNTSYVTVKLYANWNAGTWANDNPSGKIIIDGTEYPFTANFNTGQSSSGSQLLITKSKTVTHNTDGSKTVNCSATFAGNGDYTVTWSDSEDLTDIPRAASITSFPGFAVNGNVRVNISNPGGLTTKLVFKTNSIIVKTISGIYSGAVDTTISPATLYGAAANPALNTVPVAVELSTWSGSTQIGSTDTASATATLTKSITSFPGFNIGEDTIVNVNNPNGVSVKLIFKVNGVTVKTIQSTYNGKVTTTISPATMYQALSNANVSSFGISVEMTTWSGSTKLGSTQTASTTATLNASFDSFLAFFIGSGTSVSVTNPQGLGIVITFKVPSGTVVGELTGIIAGNKAVTLDPTLLYAAIPSLKTVTVTATLKVMSGSTQLGPSLTKTAIATVAAGSSDPTFSAANFSYADVDSAIFALTQNNQIIIKDYSDIRITINTPASGKNSATIVSYKVTCGTKTSTVTAGTTIINLLNVDGNVITILVTDSRGFTVSVSKTISSANYKVLTPISISKVVAARANMVDAETSLSINAKVHLLNFGSIPNSIQELYYEYKLTSSGTWLTGATALSKSVDGSGNLSIIDKAISGHTNGSLGFDTGKNYNIRVTIRDRLTTYQVSVLLIGDPLMDWGVDFPSGLAPSPYLGVGMMSTVKKGVQSRDGYYDVYGRELFVAKQVTAAQLENFTLTPGLYYVMEAIDGLSDGSTAHYVEILGGYNNSTDFVIQRAWRFGSGLYSGIWIRQSGSGNAWTVPWTRILAPPTAWIEPTLLNGWENYGGSFETAAYMRDELGFVHLRGLVRNGTIGASTPIFTEASGYRPAKIEAFVGWSSGAAAYMQVSSAGNVVVVSGNNAYVSLSGIIHKAV